MMQINSRIKSDFAHFNYKFNVLDKQLLELGEIEADTIDKMDEEVEFKNKKITHQEDKLKGLNQYDEPKVNHTAKPSVKRDRARRRMLEAMNNANKTFKQLGVKPIKF